MLSLLLLCLKVLKDDEEQRNVVCPSDLRDQIQNILSRCEITLQSMSRLLPDHPSFYATGDAGLVPYRLPDWDDPVVVKEVREYVLVYPRAEEALSAVKCWQSTFLRC